VGAGAAAGAAVCALAGRTAAAAAPATAAPLARNFLRLGFFEFMGLPLLDTLYTFAAVQSAEI
jgi:hypothetical protein